jgi:DNA-3-methyladenine glycosylase II
MFETFTTHNFQSYCDQLAENDGELLSIIRQHGYPPMWTRPNSFETLVHFILEQQVSLASALAALKKLQEETGGITPEKILELSDETMRACYVSRQKAGYIRNLAQAIVNGELDLPAMTHLPDEEVRAKLTAVKGIGNWTADVYLMFVLQRLDIFPVGDLAAVNALKRAKNLPWESKREALLAAAEMWRPYRSIATMLLWHHYLSEPFRSADFSKKQKTEVTVN